MRLTSLHLTQFRNYADLQLGLPAEDLQLFIGENGAGKTNILESVSVLAFTKSFLAGEEQDVIQWGTEFYRVTGTVQTDAGEMKELEVVSQTSPRRQKACFINGVKVQLSAMVGQMPVVLFLPQDLGLFTGSPAERRRYLDQILCQVSGEYFTALMEYQKYLKQRNALLRGIRDGEGSVEDLTTWDEGLADRGSMVTLLRLELMETFNLTLEEEARALGEDWKEVRMHYIRSGTCREREAIRDDMIELLNRNAQRDVILQSTTTGPHRDDWSLTVSGRPLQTFASRGQQRVAVLALLFLETSYIELRKGEKPLILLDDIFSELDDRHQRCVMSAFKGHQVLMTATGVPPGAEGAIWKVEGGRVEENTSIVKG